jgi:predicted nucleotidyltransferase
LKGITDAFICGSYVKNEFKPESDLDTIIIGPISENRLVKVFKNMEKAIGRELNYHLYSLIEFKNS